MCKKSVKGSSRHILTVSYLAHLTVNLENVRKSRKILKFLLYIFIELDCITSLPLQQERLFSGLVVGLMEEERAGIGEQESTGLLDSETSREDVVSGWTSDVCDCR